MPDYTDVPISSFPDAQSVDASDKVTGLKSGDNTNFSFNSILAWLIERFQTVFLPSSARGRAGGVAALDATGTVPDDQLPSIPSQPSDIGAQAEITASGILKGDGAGGVSAATAGTDYQAPLTFDNTPTASSNNPVKSGGVYDDVRTRVPNYGKGKNLLRNWYFVGGGTGRGVFPVNQRGFATSSNVNHIWSIDGWYINGGAGTQTLNSTGFYLAHTGTSGSVTLQQWVGNDAEYTGKTMTLSTIADGVLFSNTATIPQKTSATQYAINIALAQGVALNLFAPPTSESGYVVQFQATAGKSLTVQAVKLEYGTEQTLAHQENGTWVLNEIPDYEEELIKCKTHPGYTGTIPDTYDEKSLATEQQLAPVEWGTTASRAYAVGEYFCWNGLLYRVKTAISSGAAFTVETNCERVTVGGFNKLQSLVHPSSLTLTYSLIGVPLVRASSSQRKLVVSVPYGYTTATVSMQSTNILTRELGASASTTFSTTSVTASLSGYCLSVTINGTGLESAMDVLALDNGIVITLT